MARRPTVDFLKTESGAGLLLGLAALAAVLAANSPWAEAYESLIKTPIPIRLGGFSETLSLVDWIKQGLMAVFFLVVGLEIKFEVLRGELSSPRRIALPLLAALGGMLAPAAIYLAINSGVDGGVPRGWPTPVATDIAFALAALAIAGPKLSPALRVFLLTLAIADDMGAVALIALLFSAKLHVAALVGAGLVLCALAALSRWRQGPLWLYGVGFLLVWGFTLKSGIDTSVAAVACALTVPIEARRADQESVLTRMMRRLHPLVAYGVLPLFAFTAAGFSISGLSWRDLLSPVSLGVAAGLVLGKPLGVFAFAFLGAVVRLGRKPAGTTWAQIGGVAMLCGAGFTMSLYIGALAFPQGPLQTEARLGVLIGSLISVIAGGLTLRFLQRRPAPAEQ